jgi:hypothetical protein
VAFGDGKLVDGKWRDVGESMASAACSNVCWNGNEVRLESSRLWCASAVRLSARSSVG